MAKNIKNMKKEELLEIIETMAVQTEDMQAAIDTMKENSKKRTFHSMRQFYALGSKAFAIRQIRKNKKIDLDEGISKLIACIMRDAYAMVDEPTKSEIKDLIRKEREVREKAAREASGQPEPQKLVTNKA